MDRFFFFKPKSVPGSFPSGSVVKNPPATQQCKFDPWVGKIPWRRAWQPQQYSCLENPMERGAWWATVHSVAKLDMTEAT